MREEHMNSYKQKKRKRLVNLLDRVKTDKNPTTYPKPRPLHHKKSSNKSIENTSPVKVYIWFELYSQVIRTKKLLTIKNRPKKIMINLYSEHRSP